jgi:hypothetical protein
MRLSRFQVWMYRNIVDSGPIDVTDITAFVGQNESGKSNLFEALYRVNPFDGKSTYNFEEDWPVDYWGEQNKTAKVCEAHFALEKAEIESLFAAAFTQPVVSDAEGQDAIVATRPDALVLIGTASYGTAEPTFSIEGQYGALLDRDKVTAWAKENVPKFVYIHDYELSGARIELNALAERKKAVKWDQLSNEEQTILTVLQLANIDIDAFLAKGSSPEGRTSRSFDKRAASAYLSKQFQDLWRQKEVRFDIDIDATTLNIFAEDVALRMPVRLYRRSTGFRWHVAFAWKFTHASRGRYLNCVLLLEEPGIHLHYSAQNDLLQVFERLSSNNTILYTTHLASMVDQGYPERVRIVETIGHHASVKKGVVSNQRGPMAVIEMRLGLSGDMAGLLGNRNTLIVEGGDDVLIISKLAGVLRASGKESLSDSIYLWPADGAPKTPMYAAFAIGQKWDSGVLLDTDEAGKEAKKKISDLYLNELSEADAKRFRVLMIGSAAGIQKTDAAIEDLFPDEYYLQLVNHAFNITIKMEDLPIDGSDMITERVEAVLKNKFGHSTFDKRPVIWELLKRFENWHEAKDLPDGTASKAESLFKSINKTFDLEFTAAKQAWRSVRVKNYSAE